MKIVQINSTYGYGSTGKICEGISIFLTKKNIENYTIYSVNGKKDKIGIKNTNNFYIKIQALKSKIFGNYGFNSKIATISIINKLEKIKPDIVHIHNIHGHDCNVEILFKYLKKKNIKIVWTFHDCWAFTGYCPHFDMIKCDKWKKTCNQCPLRKEYSWIFDRSAINFKRKKKIFSNLNLTIVTPSSWLANLVKQSFLKDYPVEVINNGINLNIFKPIKSNFREKYNIMDKKIVLGVAMPWSKKKGLDSFIELSRLLDNRYQIILVGTDNNIDKILPDNIISIHKTHNQEELAKIYSAADVFVNPTKEENYPTVNMETIACGTPVITYKTGGSPEILNTRTGIVTKINNVMDLKESIINICDNTKKFDSLKESINFKEEIKFNEYIELYKRILKGKL